MILTLVGCIPCPAHGSKLISISTVFFAYAVVTRDSAVLFINEMQVDDEVKAHLGQEVLIQPYESFLTYLKGLTDNAFVKREEVRVFP